MENPYEFKETLWGIFQKIFSNFLQDFSKNFLKILKKT